MKRNLLIAAFLAICINSFAQKRTDRERILAVLETQRQNWNKGDLVAYMQGYWNSDSLVFVGKSGPKYGWKTTLENYKKGYPDKSAMGFLNFDIKEVRLINSSNAFVLGAWHLKREKDEPQGYFTLLLKKIKGHWKIVSDHSS